MKKPGVINWFKGKIKQILLETKTLNEAYLKQLHNNECVSIVTSLDLISAVANYNTYLFTALYSHYTGYSIKSMNCSCSTACYQAQAGVADAVLIFPMSRTNVTIDLVPVNKASLLSSETSRR